MHHEVVSFLDIIDIRGKVGTKPYLAAYVDGAGERSSRYAALRAACVNIFMKLMTLRKHIMQYFRSPNKIYSSSYYHYNIDA